MTTTENTECWGCGMPAVHFPVGDEHGHCCRCAECDCTHECQECGREFDIHDPTDAQEWYYGHDCEPAPRPRTAQCEKCGDKYEAGGWNDDGRCERHRSA